MVNWRMVELDNVDDLWFALIGAMLVVESWKIYLMIRNLKYVSRNVEVPEEMTALITPQEFQRLRDLVVQQTSVDLMETVSTLAVKVAKLFLQYYPFIWESTLSLAESTTARAAWFYGLDVFLTRSIFIPLTAISLLLVNDLRSDPILVIINMIIQSSIQALLAAAGGFGLIYLTDKLGTRGFIILIVTVNILGFYAVAFYIGSIIPKVSLPLENSPAGNSVRALAMRVGYPQEKIYVDPDKVAPPNAYYSSALGSKMIIITQALIAILQPEQLTSVVAHELGHWKFQHPTLQYAMSVIELAGLCHLWKWAYGNDFIRRLFVMEGDVHHIIPVYMSTYYIWPTIQDIYTGFVSMIGRRCEFIADNYCCSQGYGTSLKEALITLAARTKTYPLFDPWYSAWFLGHPTALERIKQINTSNDHPPPTT